MHRPARLLIALALVTLIVTVPANVLWIVLLILFGITLWRLRFTH